MRGGSRNLWVCQQAENYRAFPHFLLLTATLTSVFAGSCLRNHQKLVEGELNGTMH